MRMNVPRPTPYIAAPRLWRWLAWAGFATAVAGAAILLATAPLVLAVGVVVAPLVLVLALIDPIWALYIAVLAVPVQEVVTLPGGLSFIQAAFLLALATWALHSLSTPYHPIRLGLPGYGLLALLWALLLASTFTRYDQTAALTETLRWSTVLLIYLLAVNRLVPPEAGLPAVRHSARRFAGLAACLLLATALNGMLGMGQFFTGLGPLSFLVGDEFARAYGTIGQPNSFAGYMNMGWPLAAALTGGGCVALFTYASQRSTHQPGPYPRGVLLAIGGAGLAFCLQFGALLLSLSRGGWVGAAGGMLGLLLATLIVNWRNVQAYLGYALAGTLAIIGIGIGLGTSDLLPDFFTSRFLSIFNSLRLFDARTAMIDADNFAVVERMAQMQAAWYMFLSEPLTGVGPGNFPIAYQSQASGFAYLIHPWYSPQQHAHNYYLHIAAEAGLIGLAAYLLLLGLLAVQAWRTLRGVRGWFWQSLAIGSCGIIAAIAVHNLFENLHVLNMGVQLGSVWAMLVALDYRQHLIAEHDREQPQESV